MTNIEDLLNKFNSQETNQDDSPIDLFGISQEQHNSTPEEKDLERLEEDIHSIYTGRRFLNKAIATFLGCATANGSVHLLARLGLPAIASGSIGTILVGLFFANALCKIRVHEGKPSIEQDFLIGLTQSLGVMGAMWQAFDEYRQVSHQASIGKEKFLAEVKAYEVLPTPQENLHLLGMLPFVLLLFVGLGLLLKGGKRNEY